jgi:hypothetical protein
MISNGLRRCGQSKFRRIRFPVSSKVLNKIFGEDRILYITGDDETDLLKAFGEEILNIDPSVSVESWSERKQGTL